MKTFIVRCLVFLLVCTGLATSQSSPSSDSLQSAIQLKTVLESNTVPLNRTVHLTLRLEWTGDLARFDVHRFDNPLVENLEIVSTASTNRVIQTGGEQRSVQEFSYELKPTSLGMGYIEGMIIPYTDLNTDREHRLMTNRLQVRIVDPIPEGESGVWLLWGGIGVLLVVLAGGAAWQHYKRQQRRRREEAINAAQPTLEVSYLESLREWSPERQHSQDNTGVSEMTRLLRHYLTEKTGYPAIQTPTRLLISQLESRIHEHHLKQLGSVLSMADEIKFSGRAARPHEIDQIYTGVENMLEAGQNGELLRNQTNSEQQADQEES
jgi:hypothetical protein